MALLPITSLFNRPGLPGAGVPPMSIDPATGDVIGNMWPQGAVGVDPITGDIITKQNTRAASTTDAPPNIVYGTDWAEIPPADISDWDSGEPPVVIPPLILDVGAIRDSHGSQWNYQGSNLTESVFDRWRKAGRPSSCQKLGRGCGMGDYTFPDGSACDPAMSDPRFCSNTAARIINAVTSGAVAANNQLMYGNYPPGYGPVPGGGSVTVSGQASPIAWIVGGLIAATVLYAATRR
jgi:hypothetical protein